MSVGGDMQWYEKHGPVWILQFPINGLQGISLLKWVRAKINKSTGLIRKQPSELLLNSNQETVMARYFQTVN